MPNVSFIVLLVCILIAIGFFIYGLRLLASNNEEAGGKMNLGFGIGLIGLVLFAVMYGFFNL
jgi:hypothetical protein